MVDAGVDKRSVVDVGVDFLELDSFFKMFPQGLQQDPVSRPIVEDPAGGAVNGPAFQGNHDRRGARGRVQPLGHHPAHLGHLAAGRP